MYLKGRNFGGNLIWRMAEKVNFGGNLVWRMAEKTIMKGIVLLQNHVLETLFLVQMLTMSKVSAR